MPQEVRKTSCRTFLKPLKPTPPWEKFRMFSAESTASTGRLLPFDQRSRSQKSQNLFFHGRRNHQGRRRRFLQCSERDSARSGRRKRLWRNRDGDVDYSSHQRSGANRRRRNSV